ncbi:MAG: protein-L-isoaspartate O-methyltransferase [Pseudomonadota bacterium]
MIDFAAARHLMVESQVRAHDVTDVRLQTAMRTTPRELFAPKALQQVAYMERDIDLGDGRTLLSARTFAKLLQAADVQPGDIALDIGCGGGYSSAILAALCETVVALENSADFSAATNQRLGQLGIDNVAVVEGPLDAGKPDQGPFDVIFINGGVGAAPNALFEQLSAGGRLAAIVMQGPVGKATIFRKGKDGAVGRTVAFDATAPILPGFEPAKTFSL